MADILSATRFALMRHATTVWNERGLIQGRLDSSLSSKGEAQAREWAVDLSRHSWNRLLVSTAGRAMQTADSINEGLALPREQDDRLVEQNFGEWQGQRMKDVRANDTVRMEAQVKRGWEFRPPGGESRREVAERVCSALLDAADRHPGERILVVTHMGAIMCLVMWLEGIEFDPQRSGLKTSGSLHWLESDGKELRISRLREPILK